ncbi:unnamed protein product [Rotaria sordida]|uniref:Uncharacterized protein n=2 Tax=Rotaria sordida TaxID=392033 RepID=A0A814VF12_9BILA|nr:unnamed protein product [Rotaria sordida]CAF1457678.1 unnamed protein product [Rotaria sordida]CAF3890498.1 unnamed protein product [Rotaria sordida]
MSNKTWNDVMTSFGASHILSPTAVVEEVVRSQAEIALNKQITLAQATLARNLLAIQRMISGNEIVSGLATNFYVGYSSLNLDTWDSPRAWPRMFNDCSCLNVEGCPRPATLYNSSGHLITVPGMIIDCLIVDATLASTLECYYDQACLSLLHQSLTIAAKPLSNSSNRHFSMHSTLQMLLNELMIDEITSMIRFDLFYSQCHPAYCSYSYTSRFNVIFIVTTIAGIFGGLSFVLRLIAPFIASVILRRKNRVLSHNSALDTMPSQQNRRKLNSVLRSVLENNLREKEFIKD